MSTSTTSLKKFNLFTTEERWLKIKSRAIAKGITLQQYWDGILDKLINKIDGEGDTPGVSPLVPSARVVVPPVTPKVELSIAEPEEEYGVCLTCYSSKPKPISLVTYRDQYQTRVANRLCAQCIKNAKKAESYVGEGDLTND